MKQYLDVLIFLHSFSLIGSQALLTGQTALFIGKYAKGMYIDAVDLIL